MSNDIIEVEEDEDKIITVSEDALALEKRSDHETKVATARRYPRSISQFRKNTQELATLDEETAGSCFYTLPRGGKTLQGPSVRLAEIVGMSYGNLSYGARVVACDDKFITAQGVCYDYEKNISVSIEVQRRITDRNGAKFNDDMIQVTGRAACSIALREAIFKVVPRAIWNSIYEQAKTVSVGKGETLQAKRDKCLDFWKKAGATEKQVLEFLDRKGVEDITIEDLITLRGLVTTMKDENIGVDQVFRKDDPTKRVLNKAPSLT